MIRALQRLKQDFGCNVKKEGAAMRAMIFAALAFPGRYFMLHDSCGRRGADKKWRVFALSSRNVALHGRNYYHLSPHICAHVLCAGVRARYVFLRVQAARETRRPKNEYMTKKIAKADELPVHNRKGVGNQQEKGGGVL